MAMPLSWISDALAAARAKGLLRRRRTITPLPDGWCKVDGRRLRNFAGNDYLCLAHDSLLKVAAEVAARNAGTGSGGSALVTGRTAWHEHLERMLADFEGQPAAVTFPTGYAANVGTIGALVGPDDAIFSDELNHASLVDGCRLSRASVHIYQHLQLDMLEQLLKESQHYRRRLIVSDSLFSMDGDAAPLPEICDLADRYDAMVLIDEAHATGIFGEFGRGIAELQNVEQRGIVRVGTLSKAIGSLGGFVTGPQSLIDWLWNDARTQMFSTALPPAACAAAAAAIDVIEQEPERRLHLLKLSDRFRALLLKAKLPLVPGGIGPIFPLVLHDPQLAVAAAEELERRGYLVGAIRPPSVPEGTSRLRVTLNSACTIRDMKALAAALADVLGHVPQVQP